MNAIPEDEVLAAAGDVIGRGGQGTVYAVTGLRLPGVEHTRLAYKKYRTSISPSLLTVLVARRMALPPHVRRRLDESTAWPLGVVQRDGVVTGVLMRLVPSAFTHSLISPSGRQLRDVLRDAQFLMVSGERIGRLRLPVVDVVNRLTVCLEFSRVVDLVHGMGVVLGDINAKNAVIAIDKGPRVMLLDCDSYRVVSWDGGERQLNTPDWDVPGGDVLSQGTDRYKLGLFVLRVLVSDSLTRDPERARDVLGTRGTRLLRTALAPDVRARPTANEWIELLTALVGQQAVGTRRPR